MILLYHTVLTFSIPGAKVNSWSLYPQTKGKAEEAIKELGFNRVSIYRPGLLITERNEPRMFEKAAQCMAGFLDRSNKASIKCDDLGKAMVFNSTMKTIPQNHETLENADIVKLFTEAQSQSGN